MNLIVDPRERSDTNHPSWQDVAPHTWDRARELRKNMNAAERRLWQALRRNRLGVHFRRQHPIGPYVADFYCAERKLVIELDGDTHADQPQREHDIDRTLYLESRGLKVKRFTNLQVLRDLEGVLQDIASFIGYAFPDSPPLPPRERRGESDSPPIHGRNKRGA